MHCYTCEEPIIVTGGMLKIALFDFSKKSYFAGKIVVIECPNCRELIAITNFNGKELTKQIKVDSKVQGA